jgi:hypothetical protein
MPRLTNVKRIITEDFEPQYQNLISRLGFVLNEFMSDTVDIVNGNIDFDNLSQKMIQFDITVDANGKPLKGADVNVGKTNPSGIQVIRAQNLTNSSVYPVQAPFVNYVPKGNNIITVSNVLGLQANNQYRLTVIVY